MEFTPTEDLTGLVVKDAFVALVSVLQSSGVSAYRLQAAIEQVYRDPDTRYIEVLPGGRH